MKKIYLSVLCLVIALAPARADDLDAGVAKIAADLAATTTKASIKKISVLDFTDLQGANSELGRYIAEQLSILLANSSQGFSVMNRANLKSILEEHKLTASGLVNPENAKKLGQFSGVDAIVMGSITPFGSKLTLTAQILSTETAQVVGGTIAKIERSKEIDELLGAVPVKAVATPETVVKKEQPAKDFEAPSVLAVYDELEVELLSFRFTTSGTAVLTFRFKNRDTSGPIKLGLNGIAEKIAMMLMDENGAQYPLSAATGISAPGQGETYDYYENLHRLDPIYSKDLKSREFDRMYDLDAGQNSIVIFTFNTNGRTVGNRVRLSGEMVLGIKRHDVIQKIKLVNLFMDEIHPRDLQK